MRKQRGGFTKLIPPADKIFQHRAFSCTLTTHNSNLGKVKRHLHPQRSEGILQFIHERNKGFHSLIAWHFRWCFRRSSLTLQKELGPVGNFPTMADHREDCTMKRNSQKNTRRLSGSWLIFFQPQYCRWNRVWRWVENDSGWRERTSTVSLSTNWLEYGQPTQHGCIDCEIRHIAADCTTAS